MRLEALEVTVIVDDGLDVADEQLDPDADSVGDVVDDQAVEDQLLEDLLLHPHL